MGFNEQIADAVRTIRTASFDESDQLSLGQLTAKFETIAAKQKYVIEKWGHEAEVVLDFCGLPVIDIGSWRGAYEELAIGFNCEGDGIDVSAFLAVLVATDGKTLTGYKGGDFLMTKDTPVWVDNYGKCNHEAVIDVVDDEFQVVVVTGKREY